MCQAVSKVAVFWVKNNSQRKRCSLCCMYVFDILPGLKCHSCSSEDDTSATRTVTTVTGNSRSKGKAMTAATHMVTCPVTHWWPQAYLGGEREIFRLRSTLGFLSVPTVIRPQMILIFTRTYTLTHTHTALAWGCWAHTLIISINNSTLSIKFF